MKVVGKGHRLDRGLGGGDEAEIITCMRELDKSPSEKCRVSDIQVAIMANGPLVFIFSSPELKAQVSFSDHLSSVVCL